MKKLPYIMFALFSLLFSSHLQANSQASDEISIVDPYVRAVPPGQKISAAFLQLDNASDTMQSIVSASSPAAEVVELHTHIHDNGMMKMRRIEKIDIPAKGKTVLKPGGLHIMLIDLKNNLKPGQEVSVTLKFSDGSEKNFSAPVRKIQMPGMMKKMQH